MFGSNLIISWKESNQGHDRVNPFTTGWVKSMYSSVEQKPNKVATTTTTTPMLTNNIFENKTFLSGLATKSVPQRIVNISNFVKDIYCFRNLKENFFNDLMVNEKEDYTFSIIL
jgi:hypothetical protein